MKDTERALSLYQSINKELTIENNRLRQELNNKNAENLAMNELVQAERQQSAILKAKITELLTRLSSGYFSFQTLIQTNLALLAEFTPEIFPTSSPVPNSMLSENRGGSRSHSQPSNSATATPGRQVKVQPRIKTPYGIVQNLQIKLPRVDTSLASTSSSSAASPRPLDRSSSPTRAPYGNAVTIHRPVRNLARRSLDYDEAADPVSPAQRANVSEQVADEPARAEVEANGEQDDGEARQSDAEGGYQGLLPIVEVTEPESSVNDESSASSVSSSRYEATLHPSQVSLNTSSFAECISTPTAVRRRTIFLPSTSNAFRASPNNGNKENSLTLNESNISSPGILMAVSSTPYIERPRLSLKFPKIVLQPLTQEELTRYNNIANVGAEAAPEETETRQTRKRKVTTPLETSLARPKRSKAPTNLTEPKLIGKMRRT